MARMKSVNNASRGVIDSRSSPKKRGMGGGEVAPMETLDYENGSGAMMSSREFPTRRDEELSSAAQALNILRKDREASRAKTKRTAPSRNSFIVLNDDPLNVKTASVHENSYVPLNNIMAEVKFADVKDLSLNDVSFKLGDDSNTRKLQTEEKNDDRDDGMQAERLILIRAAQRHESYMLSVKLPEAMKMLHARVESIVYLHPEWKLAFSRIQMARGVYDHLQELIVNTLKSSKKNIAGVSLDTLNSVQRGVDILVRQGFVELYKSPPMSAPRFQSIQWPQDSPIELDSMPYSFETMLCTHTAIVISDAVRGQPLLAIRRCYEIIRRSREPLDIADILIVSALVCELYCLMRNGVNNDAGIRAFRAMQEVDNAMAQELNGILRLLQRPSQSTELKGMITPGLFHEVWDKTYNSDESIEQIELLRWAVCLNPRAQLGWLCLAWSLDAFSSKRDLAKEAAMVGINVEPGNPEAWILCGNLYQRRQQYEDAKEAFKAAKCITSNGGHERNLTVIQSLLDNISREDEHKKSSKSSTTAEGFFDDLKKTYTSFFRTSHHMDLLVNHIRDDGNSKVKASAAAGEPFILKELSPANDPGSLDNEPECPQKEPTEAQSHDQETVVV